MPRHQIKNYVEQKDQATCSVCSDQGRAVEVKGWAKAHCDNCGKVVCQRHRPYFQKYWTCPVCVKQQQQLVNAPSIATPALMPQTPFEAAQPKEAPDFMRDMALAQALFDNGRTAEAKCVTEEIFALLMGSYM